jgi:hypothetical protein
MPKWTPYELMQWQAARDAKLHVGDFHPTEVAKRQAKAATMAEKELHEQIMGWLRLKGVKAIVHSRMDRKSTVSPAGCPDLIFAVHGKPVALEVKVGSNQPSPEQIAWLDDLMEDGWICRVVRSLDDVIATYNTL